MSYNTNNIDKVLGQKVDSPTTYCPSVLVREERQRNRSTVGLDGDKLPFVGYDIWNGYECSCLTSNGLPVTCIAKVVYSATNKYIVESKSMKLYWNSFNMEPMGFTPREALKNLKITAENDLSRLLETPVKVGLFSQVLQPVDYVMGVDEWAESYGDNWEVLEAQSKVNTFKFNVFNESPDLLVTKNSTNSTHHWYMSTLLRSNCKITKQPDSGDIFIYYSGRKTVTKSSLLKWIVSFRNECHFHEEICETAYKRLWDSLSPDELAVTCFYARRGGWDINPTRASHGYLLPCDLITHSKPYYKFPRQ